MTFKCVECGSEQYRTFDIEIPPHDKPGVHKTRIERANECLKCGRVEIDNSKRDAARSSG
jgi:predicted nucleic-acid-binding Zn-ribbon protein